MIARPLLFFLSLLVFSIAPVQADNEDLKEKIHQARDALIQEGQENRKLKVKLDQQEGMISELREELEKLEQQIEDEEEG